MFVATALASPGAARESPAGGYSQLSFFRPAPALVLP